MSKEISLISINSSLKSPPPISPLAPLISHKTEGVFFLVFLSAFEKEKHFIENKESNNPPIKKCFGPMLAVIFCADGYTYWCTEFRGVPEYRLGNWAKDGYDSIYKEGLIEEMDNFIDCHKCSIQCKYFNLKQEDDSWKGCELP